MTTDKKDLPELHDKNEPDFELTTLHDILHRILRHKSVLGYIIECDSKGKILTDKPISSVYDDYTIFCAEKGLEKVSRYVFTREVHYIKGLEAVPSRLQGYDQTVRTFRSDYVKKNTNNLTMKEKIEIYRRCLQATLDYLDKLL